MFKRKRVHFHFQFSASFREETRGLKKFLVVPGIIIQEQVLNYYFVPAEEINTFPESWNDRPVTIRHPNTQNGSAGWVDQMVIGRIYNVRYDASTTKLHAEFWMELAELNKSEDGREIERRVRAGETLEVSTGYWANEEFVEGVWQDVPYFAIHHDLRPDHVAILVDQIGACSVEDGCGMPRVNCAECEGDQALVTNFKNAKQAKKKGLRIMAFFSKKNKKAKKPTPVKVKIEDPAQLAAFALLNVNSTAVEGEENVYLLTNAAMEEVEEPEVKTNDEDAEPQRDPFALELEEALEPIGGAAGFGDLLKNLQGVVEAFKANSQSEETKKAQLIKKLTKNKGYPLSAESLQKLSLPEVQALVVNQESQGFDFGALGAADVVALNAGDEDGDDEDDADDDEVQANKTRKSRGIGLAGTLGDRIDLNLNNRRHARGGVK